MALDTILKLLPNDEDSNHNGRVSRAFYLLDFLEEYKLKYKYKCKYKWKNHDSSIATETNQELPEELSKMIIAPLPTCRMLVDDSATNRNTTRTCTESGSTSGSTSGSKTNIYLQRKNKYYDSNHRDRCQQSARSIVDDVVFSLVQKREKLRCKRNHERKNSFKRRQRRQHRNGKSAACDSPNSSSTTSTIVSYDDRYCGANALVHGFGVSREGDSLSRSTGSTKPGITYQHPNENVTFCKSSPIIKALHEMVGDEAFRMILMHTRCFFPIIRNTKSEEDDALPPPSVPCNRNQERKGKRKRKRHGKDEDSCNYILLCGPPLLFESNRLRTMVGCTSTKSRARAIDVPQSSNNTIHKNEKKKKRKRSFPTSLAENSPLRANESISRFSLLYSDSYVPRVALPRSHPFPQRLERQKQNKVRNPWKQNQQPKKLCARPHHHECPTMDNFNFMLNVIFELHLENKNKQRRIRKRLKGMGRMVFEKIWKNYGSYHDYGRLLTKYCPLPQVYHEVSTSTSHDSANDENLAKLAHAYTSKETIVSFLSSVLRRVYPTDFWGSHANFRSFLVSVRSFVHLRKQEKLANKNIMNGISVTSMKWLYPAVCENTDRTRNGQTKKRKVGKQRTNHEAATELTLQTLRWVFKGFIIPLLRSCFYVTETEFAARELHYYRKPIWSMFRALSLRKLTMGNFPAKIQKNQEPEHTEPSVSSHFRVVPHSRAFQCLLKQSMGISKLRFLPKATGMRPIAQLARSAHINFSPNILQEPIPSSGIEPVAVETQVNKENKCHHSKRARIQNNSPQETLPTKKRRVEDQSSTGTFELESKSKSDVSSTRGLTKCTFSRSPTNTILENVLDVLTYECAKKDRPCGNGLGNLHEFYIRYRNYMTGFKQSLPNGRFRRSKNPRKLFFAKIDIEKCYDRIHQDVLLRLVQDMVFHNSYVVQTIKLNCANQKQRAKAGDNALRFKKSVETIEEYKSFHHCEHPIAQKQQRTVFEILKCSLVDKERILELLREHLLQHFVVATGRHKPKILLQTRGISQGSTLSMLLCNLYYGKMEELMKLGDIRQTSGSIRPNSTGRKNLVSRFVDDFLFVTPNENAFREFLDKTHKGKPELGAKVNPNKTLVNAEASVGMPSNEGGTKYIELSQSDRVMNNGRKVFPWCGLLFDTSNGEVFVDYSRFRDGKLRQSLTIDADGSEGEQLAQRLRAFLFPRCLPILYDDSINSFETIIANFYQMMLFGACKTKEYILGLNSSMKRHPYYIHNVSFLLKCISELSDYAMKNIRSKARHCILNNNNNIEDTDHGVDQNQVFRFRIHPEIALALSLQAFGDVFSYSSGFCRMARILRQTSLAASKGIPDKKLKHLRIITARALDDFRINAMLEK